MDSDHNTFIMYEATRSSKVNTREEVNRKEEIEQASESNRIFLFLPGLSGFFLFTPLQTFNSEPRAAICLMMDQLFLIKSKSAVVILTFFMVCLCKVLRL